MPEISEAKAAISKIEMGYIGRNDAVTNEGFEPDEEALIFLNDDNEQTCHVEGPNAKAMAKQIIDAVTTALSGHVTEWRPIESAGHTPTPWCTREDSSNCISICFDPQHPNAEGDEIASVYREGICINDEMRADAALIVSAVNNHAALIETLRPFAWYFDLNDCQERSDDDALEVPIRDLRIAYQLFMAMGPKVQPLPPPPSPDLLNTRVTGVEGGQR